MTLTTFIAVAAMAISLTTAYFTPHDRRERRRQRRAEIPRMIEAHDVEVQAKIEAVGVRERDEVQTIANVHKSRGMYYSSSRENVQQKPGAKPRSSESGSDVTLPSSASASQMSRRASEVRRPSRPRPASPGRRSPG